jgi:hypothetical protein
MHSKSVCRDFGCIGHCLCRTFSNCTWLLPEFLPCGLHSIVTTSCSGLRFRGFPELFHWPLSKWLLALPCLSLLCLGKRLFSSSSWLA